MTKFLKGKFGDVAGGAISILITLTVLYFLFALSMAIRQYVAPRYVVVISSAGQDTYKADSLVIDKSGAARVFVDGTPINVDGWIEIRAILREKDNSPR